MGEAPGSLSDRVYVMWSIRLRAALGFKEALPGYLAVADRWGPETSIAVEALCNGGCQYSPVRAADAIYFPCKELNQYHALRSMLCPTDEQLGDFYLTWQFAEEIAFANLEEFPIELRGFESFRSPSVTWINQVSRPSGQRSVRFFPEGNIWRDEYPQDNAFWEEWDLVNAVPIATATAKALSTATIAAPTATHTPPPRPTVLPAPTIGATLTASPAGREERRIELIYCFPLGASVLAILILTLRDLRRKHGHRD
jgi:hypothetical protein